MSHNRPLGVLFEAESAVLDKESDVLGVRLSL